MNPFERLILGAIVALLWVIVICLASIWFTRWKTNRRLTALMSQKYPTHAERQREES